MSSDEASEELAAFQAMQAEMEEEESDSASDSNNLDASESDDESQSDDQPFGPNHRGPPKPVYDAAAIRLKIADIAWAPEPPLAESLTIPTDLLPAEATSSLSASLQDGKKDLERELAFYSVTLSGLDAMRERLEQGTDGGAPLRVVRPDDYLAMMLKTDAHMQRIKARLMTGTKKLTSISVKAANEQAAKFSKQVAAESRTRKRDREKDAGELLGAWRRAKKQGEVDGEFDYALFEAALGEKDRERGRGGARGGRGRGRGGGRVAGRGISRARLAKQAKFGRGSGKNRYERQRDRDNNDDSGSKVEATAEGMARAARDGEESEAAAACRRGRAATPTTSKEKTSRTQQ
eukprot:CAMPEP_0170738982 /NCGR_PEP_ID=MMETSP0437-20130122/4926_1 /TAXON_ID=0 /ORGANISM="Sexangularia sp." /LENGTH=348 /DNA_ID=CAMNT_0011077423 /DNA_START=125 /DNA_END=1169 /DNA_ORIENTATION=+